MIKCIGLLYNMGTYYEGITGPQRHQHVLFDFLPSATAYARWLANAHAETVFYSLHCDNCVMFAFFSSALIEHVCWPLPIIIKEFDTESLGALLSNFIILCLLFISKFCGKWKTSIKDVFMRKSYRTRK